MLGWVPMDLINYYKEAYQFQFGQIEVETSEKFREKIEIIQKNENLIFENEGYHSSENFPRLTLYKESWLKNILNEVDHITMNKEMVCLQVVVLKELLTVPRGSYSVRNDTLLQTGMYEEELLDLVKDKNIIAILLICSNVKWLNFLGKTSFVNSLKKTGEIRLTIKKSAFQNNITAKVFDTNFNSLAHAAGININNLFVLEAIALYE